MTIDPESKLPFVEDDWTGSIVVVQRGEVVVETANGVLSWFEGGDILPLAGLSLCALHNHTADPTVLLAISRTARPGEHPVEAEAHDPAG